MRILPIVVVLGFATAASAEPGFRQIGASSRLIGCTSWAAISCDSTTQTRLGLTIVDLQWRRTRGLAPVAMFQAAGRTAEHRLFSQVIVGAGLRLDRGRWFVQGGPGIAAWRFGLGPKTITTRQILDRAVPALLGGIGLRVPWNEDPVEISVDAGIAMWSEDDLRVKQITASLTRKF